MSLLLFNNKGLIKNGLVALYDPYMDTAGRNILPIGSENFVTGWIVGTGTPSITITPNQPDPYGGNNAYRIQSSGGTALIKYACPLSSLSNPHTAYQAVNIKVLSGKAFVSGDNVTYKTQASSSWSVVSALQPNRAATSNSLSLSTENIGDSLDILVYQPQINLSQLYPYSLPSGLPQSLTDRSGKGNHAQLGSTSGADTNDPSFNGIALIYTTDDYTISPIINGLDMRNFSRIIIGKFNGISGVIASLSDSATTTKYQAIKQASSGNISIISRNGGAEMESSPLTVNTSSVVAICLTAKDGLLTLENLSTGASITLADTAPNTTCRTSLGCIGGSVVSQIISAMTYYGGEQYIKALSSSEKKQNYKYFQKLMSQRGITI